MRNIAHYLMYNAQCNSLNVVNVEMTSVKLRQLHESFPSIEESTLLEVLLSCNGSLKTAEALLSESFPNYTPKHQARSIGTARQSNITTLFGQDVNTVVRKTSKSNKPVHLYTKQDVENTLQFATIHYDFLPKDLADSLLTYIMEDKDGFSNQEFYLFGKKCQSNHQSKVYSEEFRKDYYYNGQKHDFKYHYNDEMKMAQLLIEDKVNSEIQARKKLPFQDSRKWTGAIAVCNRFLNKSNDLDWHSDRMTYIGPHCIIASLTLGACREFRVRRNYTEDGSPPTIYSIPLPHNTLVIMHAGFQEEYRHCVSSTTELQEHEISGSLRVNLTYRSYIERFKDNLPMCKRCGSQMDLRRSFKTPESRGRYIWLCTGGYQGNECNGFHWANFKSDDLIAQSVDDCSIWINKTDHVSLAAFREQIKERRNGETMTTL